MVQNVKMISQSTSSECGVFLWFSSSYLVNDAVPLYFLPPHPHSSCRCAVMAHKTLISLFQQYGC